MHGSFEQKQRFLKDTLKATILFKFINSSLAVSPGQAEA